MPTSVTALAKYGKYHGIEVEDEFHAIFDFAGNATGTIIIATTGEAPGVNRLEIATDNGLITLEGGAIHWRKTEVSVSAVEPRMPPGFPGRRQPGKSKSPLAKPAAAAKHTEVLVNFIEAILDGTPLIAPAPEGIKSVEIANAILYASHGRRTIDLPLQSADYAQFLAEKVAGSRFQFGK